MSAFDVEGDALTYNITSGTNVISTLAGNDLTFTPAQDFNGNESFTLTVSDGYLEDFEIFTLTVNAVNDAPTLVTIDNQVVAEDSFIIIDLIAADVDGDDLTYSLTSGVNIESSIDGSTITFSVINENYFGSEDFTVSVTDGEYIVSDSFTVTVDGVNDAPLLGMANEVIFEEGQFATTSIL